MDVEAGMREESGWPKTRHAPVLFAVAKVPEAPNGIAGCGWSSRLGRLGKHSSHPCTLYLDSWVPRYTNYNQFN